MKQWSSKIAFKSSDSSLSFILESDNQDLLISFFDDLCSLYGDISTRKVEALQINSEKNKETLFKILDCYKKSFPPSINQIYAFFNRLKTNQYFLFLPNIELDTISSVKLNNYLVSLETKEDINKLNSDIDEIFENTFKFYDFKLFGTYRIFIGKKYNRKCRFCDKSEPETTFNNKSHSISEALGNKKVFTYEECDTCNDEFSISIEPDLINYLTIHRVFFDVKGKGGSKTIKGANFELQKNESVEIKMFEIADRPNFEENPNEYNLNLKLNEKVNLQDIYRCLTKFVLSVLDSKHLEDLQETVKWVKKKSTEKKLPKIGELLSYHHFTLEPKLFVYIRKTGDSKLPHIVGELHFTCRILVFIIPFSKKDSFDFSNPEIYDYFWKEFNHYSKTKGWIYKDFSEDKEKDFSINLNMQKKVD